MPEWEEYYLNYDGFLDKIETIIKKMRKGRMRKFQSDHYHLSESFSVMNNEDNNLTQGPDEFFNQDDKPPKDDSLSFTKMHVGNQDDNEAPLISITTDIKEIIEDFIHDCKHVDEFYNREKARISSSFDRFYERFLIKINSNK